MCAGSENKQESLKLKITSKIDREAKRKVS